MKHRFKYAKFGSYFRPVIQVALRHNDKEFKYLALIDSGADLNIFHANLASILGIDISKLKTHSFEGIKKEASALGYLSVIKIGIDNIFFDTPVVFSSDISDSGYGILGQQGFFNHFRVKMDYKGKDIELKSNK